MASHAMQLQRSSIEARIRTLVNNDLKELCKLYGQHISGTKVVLQRRVIQALDLIIKTGDQQAFDLFCYRATHHGSNPPPGEAPAPYRSSSAATSNRASTGNGLLSSAARVTGKWFKSSPFYEIADTVLGLQDLPEMPANRHTVRANISLTHEHITKLREDRSMRLLLYCGHSSSMSMTQTVDISFPNQLEVRINGDDVKSNYKGLKNKPGSTKPADITDRVRQTAHYQNQISITYALTTKRFAFVVYLAKYIDAPSLTKRIELGQAIPRHKVVEELAAKNDDDDIAATSVRMSLKDPISTLRITLPVRSTVCMHNQCFDGAMFMALQDQAPQWTCPVCNKSVTFDMLCVDKYFEEILLNTPSSTEKVDIEPDGTWKIIREEDEASAKKPNQSARAAYDTEFDDDLVELFETPAMQPIEPSAATPTPQSLPMAQTPSALAVRNLALNTPPLSSRDSSVAQSATSAPQGTKRSVGAVIDLTLSDDDEPPRPAKRQSTSTHRQHSGQPPSFTAPRPLNSLSDSRLPPPSRGHSQTADPRRSSSGASQQQQQQSMNRTRLAVDFATASDADHVGRTARGGSVAAATPQSPYLSERQSSVTGMPDSWLYAAWPGTHPPAAVMANSGSTYEIYPSRPPSSSLSATPTPSTTIAQPALGTFSHLRLPPMQVHPSGSEGFSSGSLRNDYSAFSQSPG